MTTINEIQYKVTMSIDRKDENKRESMLCFGWMDGLYIIHYRERDIANKRIEYNTIRGIHATAAATTSQMSVFYTLCRREREKGKQLET